MSARRFSLDSNLLVYFFDPRDPHKQALAQQIILASAARDCVLGLQSIGEFYSVTTRKKILPASLAGHEALNFLVTFPSFQASGDCHRIAVREAWWRWGWTVKTPLAMRSSISLMARRSSESDSSMSIF